MDYNNLIIKNHDKVLHIILNRIDKYNALSNDLLNELNHAFNSAKNDDSINCVFISSSSEKAFCAGGDLNEMKLLNKQQAEKQSLFVQDTFKILQEIKVPVISFISGICYGGGLELALHTDIRICTETTVFAMPEVKYGIMPGGGGTVLMPQTIGVQNAMYYLLLGKELLVDEAKNMGLIQQIIPQNELQTSIDNNIKYFANSCRESLISIKKMLYKSSVNNNNLYNTEAKLFAELLDNGGTKGIDNVFVKGKN